MNILLAGGAGFLGSHFCDFLLEKGQFQGSLENKEEKFIEACKTMNFTEDMQVRTNESIDDFLLLSDKDKDFSQYMMVIGANVLDNANDTILVNSFADSFHEALTDRDNKQFDVVFDKIPGKEMKMYRYQLLTLRLLHIQSFQTLFQTLLFWEL